MQDFSPLFHKISIFSVRFNDHRQQSFLQFLNHLEMPPFKEIAEISRLRVCKAPQSIF